jgi:hypothetical protein
MAALVACWFACWVAWLLMLVLVLVLVLEALSMLLEEHRRGRWGHRRE